MQQKSVENSSHMQIWTEKYSYIGVHTYCSYVNIFIFVKCYCHYKSVSTTTILYFVYTKQVILKGPIPKLEDISHTYLNSVYMASNCIYLTVFIATSRQCIHTSENTWIFGNMATFVTNLHMLCVGITRTPTCLLTICYTHTITDKKEYRKM